MKEIFLKKIFETYDKLKLYKFVIHRKDNKIIVIEFREENFYHLIGLHKMDLDMYFPDYIKTQKRKYKYMKKHINQFESIINDKIRNRDMLKLRVITFVNILDMLENNSDTSLYDIRIKDPTSMYNGEYALNKTYNDLYCLLGLKVSSESGNNILCVSQSWMPSKRKSRLIQYKRPLYIESIEVIPNKDYSTITN